MVLTGYYLEGGVGTGTNGQGGGGSGMFWRKKLGGDKKLCAFIVIEV